MVLKMKIAFNGDVRRLRAVPRDFASLCVEAFETHEIPLQDRTNLVLKYIDDEGGERESVLLCGLHCVGAGVVSAE